jgi:hypothetical protein
MPRDFVSPLTLTCAFGCVLTCGLISSVAEAQVIVTGTYSITANTNPSTGLPISTLDDLANPFTLDLTNGVSQAIPNFFELFTTDTSFSGANDFVPQPITVMFDFTSPNTISGTVTGTTVAATDAFGDEFGEVTWNAPIFIGNPGSVGGTEGLEISLSPTEFDLSFGGVTFGGNGVVQMTIDAVPEPSAVSLLAVALAGFVGLRHLRRKRKAV